MKTTTIKGVIYEIGDPIVILANNIDNLRNDIEHLANCNDLEEFNFVPLVDSDKVKVKWGKLKKMADCVHQTPEDFLKHYELKQCRFICRMRPNKFPNSSSLTLLLDNIFVD